MSHVSNPDVVSEVTFPVFSHLSRRCQTALLPHGDTNTFLQLGPICASRVAFHLSPAAAHSMQWRNGGIYFKRYQSIGSCTFFKSGFHLVVKKKMLSGLSFDQSCVWRHSTVVRAPFCSKRIYEKPKEGSDTFAPFYVQSLRKSNKIDLTSFQAERIQVQSTV